jgi:hypothetical protein
MKTRHFVPTDSFGYLEDLRDALADPALHDVAPDGYATSEAALAAYQVAVCLGYCRLHGLSPGNDLPNVLAPHLAIAAATRLANLLPEWVEKANRLGEAWENVGSAAEADDLCIGLLKRRNWAWAIDLVTGEAYVLASSEGNPGAAPLAAAIDQMHGILDRFDDALAAQIEILSTLCGTNWLANQRADLAPELRDNLPWWLDGRLEEIVRRIEAEVLRESAAEVIQKAHVRLAPKESVIPASEPQLALAAKEWGISVVPGARLSWVSPGGVWRAVLRVPTPLTKEEDEKQRSLSFVHCEDNSPATDLQDEPVRFAPEPVEPYQIDSEGDILVRLSDLRKFDLQRLRVGDPPTDWVRE